MSFARPNSSHLLAKICTQKKKAAQQDLTDEHRLRFPVQGHILSVGGDALKES
jgi:hypothetical protein